MKQSRKHIEFLILKSLSGEATFAEKHEIEKWLNKSSDNISAYNKLKFTHHIVGEISINKSKTDSNWQKIRQKIKNSYKVPEYITLEEPSQKIFYIGRKEIRNIAAILLVFTVIGFLVNKYVSNTKTIQLVACGQNIKKANILPDGSEIYLNNGSSIEYSNSFNEKNRELELHGEGYFKVSPNKEKPFIIHCLNSTTQVVGTSFNIKTDTFSKEIIISVLTGKVRFFETNKPYNKVFLEKGEEGRVNLITNKISKSKIKDRNFLAWQTGVLIFEDCPLVDVLNSLGKYYNKRIINQGIIINNFKITSKYENQNLGQILKELSILTKMEYQIVNDSIIIKKRVK